MNDANPLVLKSPPALLNNGSFGSECRWLVKHSVAGQILGLAFNSLRFHSVYDILAVNDGPSVKSPPLLQVTTSNRNNTMRQSIRSTGQYLWIAFKPLDFNSEVSVNVTVHGQGGYHYGNGNISMKPTVGNDTIFLLEVDDNQLVLLNFTSYSFNHPATLSIYNGFDTSDLLTTLHGNVWYPIVSKGPRMMVVATNFESGTFSAEFKGVTCGCLQMSTLSTESYILSGNCNSTCVWVIPPQNVLNSDLLVNLQYISLEQGDDVQILSLDAKKTVLGAVTPNMSFVPRLIVDSQIGALVKVTRGICKKTDDVVLVGHSTYIPACRKTMSPNVSELFQVTSPLYPDTYPILANCRWVISTSEANLVHIAFDKFKLKPNHCVTIQGSGNKTISFEGSELPDDIFVKGGTVIEFNSNNCKKSETGLTLSTSEGFLLNGTVADCGGVLQSSSGEFNTNISGSNKTLCIWKVSVPATSGADVNVISYTLTKKDDKKN
ncbi:Cubilin, partial [Stegodyphus mimosarum]